MPAHDPKPTRLPLLQPWRDAALIAGIYALGASCWIIGSDKIASFIAGGDPLLLSEIDTYKGLFFVSVTTLMLFGGVLYISRRRELYVQEQQRMENILAITSKYESLGQLAGSLAHDFNNVLTVVHATAELAESSPPEETKELLTSMKSSVMDAQSSIRHLMTFARNQPVDLAVYDLCEAIKEASPLIIRIVGFGIKVETKIPDSPVLVHGARDILLQGLLNLSSNARDAMEQHTQKTLSITLSTTQLKNHVSPFCKGSISGPHARLDLRDTGSGISQEHMVHLFTPLFTTKPAGQGTGLGLASALRAAQLHQGWIEVQSAPGSGTCFSIFIPLHNNKHSGS